MVQNDIFKDDEVRLSEERSEVGLARNVQRYSSADLLALIGQVEDAVHRGTAQMYDVDVFVRCQRELARREVRYIR